MGGDRDGNPNVTADITRHVLLLSRWKATDLFLKDIQVLVSQLSMVEATPELLALVGEEGAAEPYRYLMKNLRSRLMATQAWLEARLKGEELPKPEGLLTQNEELWEPLYAARPVTSGVWHGYYRQRRSARHPAPREMFRRTAGPY
ncbi:phosphoenolpyruvate carboxylase [Escherichia coli]